MHAAGAAGFEQGGSTGSQLVGIAALQEYVIVVDLKRFQSTFFAGGRRLVQQMHQPRRAQRAFQAAAGNIGAAVGVALKLMDLLGAVVTGRNRRWCGRRSRSGPEG